MESNMLDLLFLAAAMAIFVVFGVYAASLRKL
jgi:hypothetical protein